MNRCKDCRWWTDTDQYNGIVHPIDEDTYEEKEMPFLVRECKQPDQAFCERPVWKDGFALADGSGYMAHLYTAEDFGCVKFVPMEVEQ